VEAAAAVEQRLFRMEVVGPSMRRSRQPCGLRRARRRLLMGVRDAPDPDCRTGPASEMEKGACARAPTLLFGILRGWRVLRWRLHIDLPTCAGARAAGTCLPVPMQPIPANARHGRICTAASSCARRSGTSAQHRDHYTFAAQRRAAGKVGRPGRIAAVSFRVDCSPGDRWTARSRPRTTPATGTVLASARSREALAAQEKPDRR